MTPPIRMVSVPVEPTPDMIIAGGIAICEARGTALFANDEADACYRAMLTAAPVREEGGAVDRVMAVLNNWFDGTRRIDRNSEMVRQLAALATRAPADHISDARQMVEAPAGAGDDLVAECRLHMGAAEAQGHSIVADRYRRIINALRAQPQARSWGWDYEICTGCSASLTVADIKAGGHVSCCPDRRMVTVRDLVDAYEAQRKPPARDEAQPVGMRVHLVRGKNYGNLTIRHWASIGGLTEGEHVLYTTPPAPEAEKLRDCEGCGAPPLHMHEDGCRVMAANLAALQQEGRP